MHVRVCLWGGGGGGGGWGGGCISFLKRRDLSFHINCLLSKEYALEL